MAGLLKGSDLDRRREIERSLFALGLSIGDIAKALDVSAGSVENDLKKIGETVVKFDITHLTLSQRRDKAFHHAFLELFSIKESFKREKESFTGLESIGSALCSYLCMDYINGIADGVSRLINTMTSPADPIEYAPYRILLREIFGERRQNLTREKLLLEFYWDIPEKKIELTRDSFSSQLADWAFTKYSPTFRVTLDKSVQTAVDQAISTISNEQIEETIRLRFGLSGEKALILGEIGVRLNLSGERIRQMETKGLRKLRSPEGARRLSVFLESPFGFTQRKVGEMFNPTVRIPTVVYEEKPPSRSIDEILDTPIGEFDFSRRSYNVFMNNGIKTVADLVQTDEKQLLGFRHFGRSSLKELREKLAAMGLTLGMKIEDGVLHVYRSLVVDTVQD